MDDYKYAEALNGLLSSLFSAKLVFTLEGEDIPKLQQAEELNRLAGYPTLQELLAGIPGVREVKQSATETQVKITVSIDFAPKKDRKKVKRESIRVVSEYLQTEITEN